MHWLGKMFLGFMLKSYELQGRNTGRPRLVRELCPKKHRTNQNRTNQESTKILLKID